jgi:hypothetical protein
MFRIETMGGIRAMGVAVWAVWTFAAPVSARADIIDQSTEVRKVRLADAPSQIRRDLIGIFAECGTPANIVQSTVLVEVGPFGGVGRSDYSFSFTKSDFPRPWNSAEFPLGGRCTGNYEWFTLWMHLSGDTYKQFVMVGDSLVSRRGHFIVFDVGCNGTPWWSRGHFVVWDPKRAAFTAISKCMSKEAAPAWMKAHGYQ